MCRKIRQNGRDISPGDTIKVSIKSPTGRDVVNLTYGADSCYNARIESYKDRWVPFGWNPCRVPVDGFYEIKGKQEKYFKCDVDLAALYKQNRVVILTKESSKSVRKWHCRMPYVLEKYVTSTKRERKTTPIEVD